MSDQKTELERKKASLRVVTFWLFVVAVFGWVVPYSVIFVLNLAVTFGNVGQAIAISIVPSLLPFAVTVVLCVIVYFLYRKLILKI